MSDAVREVFLHDKTIWVNLLGALEQADMHATPRMVVAECFQAIMEEKLQRDIRQMFEDAELECRLAYHGKYEPEKMNDPVYKVTSAQLWMAAGYWARMFAISANPLPECEKFLHTKYTADVRRDGILKDCFIDILTKTGRAALTEQQNKAIGDLCIVERDLYGQFRMDRSSDQQFLVHSCLCRDIGKTVESFGVIQHPPIEEFGNFFLEVTDTYQGRWRRIEVKCGPEEGMIPFEEPIFVPEYKQPVATAWYNYPLISRREETGTSTYSFDLANITEDWTLLGQLTKRDV